LFPKPDGASTTAIEALTLPPECAAPAIVIDVSYIAAPAIWNDKNIAAASINAT
jgi:hypothetical protein